MYTKGIHKKNLKKKGKVVPEAIQEMKNKKATGNFN